ncbi:MAG TPA: hypothetical protein VFH95_04650 [Candidatus Kapabacteria bacterium]|nr:hypothetical protein [Candidatus Kapabacteria bacterium]
MERIDFDTTMESGGVIRIPREYVKKLAANENIHVTLSGKQPQRASVKMMREEPLDAGDGIPLTRDELYDRK